MGLANSFLAPNSATSNSGKFDLSFLDNMKIGTAPQTSAFDKFMSDNRASEGIRQPSITENSEGGLFGNPNFAGNVAGLASAFTSLISLPQMLKNAKLQNKSLAFNLSTAKEEQERRNTMIKNINKSG